jgi:hypothetical protein
MYLINMKDGSRKNLGMYPFSDPILESKTKRDVLGS